MYTGYKLKANSNKFRTMKSIENFGVILDKI